EAILREHLQAIVPQLCGASSPITAIHRGRSEYSSSYECAIISVQLANGEQFKVFLKDFGFSHIPKTEPHRRRERELRVYRDLLAGAEAELGTARYYGCVWDGDERNGQEGRHWLLLEHMEGTEVRYCDFRYWVEAVRWLGR